MNNQELSYEEFIAKHRIRIHEDLNESYREYSSNLAHDVSLNSKAFAPLFIVGGLAESFLISSGRIFPSVVFAIVWVVSMLAIPFIDINQRAAYYLFRRYHQAVVVKEYTDRLKRQELLKLFENYEGFFVSNPDIPGDIFCKNCNYERVKIENFYDDCAKQVLRYEHFELK